MRKGICSWSNVDLDLKPHLALIYRTSVGANPNDVGVWIHDA